MVQKEKKIWTVLELLEWTTGYLAQKNFDHPRLNVEWLLCDTLGYKRVELYMNTDRPLNAQELAAFKEKLNRRLQHEPLQYIVGATEFMGLPFKVTPAVLIPRPDTEILVEKTLEICKLLQDKGDPIRVLDIGTGSGAVAVSVAFFLKKRSADFSVTAIDVSEAALAVAIGNSERNGTSEKIRFTVGDVFGDLSSVHGQFNVIVSNPPYISETEFQQLPAEVRQFEPESALRGGRDGLDFYRKMAAVAKDLFASERRERAIVLEIGYDQAPAVEKILKENQFKEIEITKDYNQQQRVVSGKL